MQNYYTSFRSGGYRFVYYQEVDKEGKIYLKFWWDKDIIRLIKSFKNYRWYEDKKLWSIPQGNMNLKILIIKLLRMNCKPIASEIHLDKKSDRPIIANRPVKSDDPHKKLLNFMILRNYSDRTIDAYEFHLKAFLKHFGKDKVNELHAEQINEYIQDIVLLNNYSRSYQNQLINAIKVYYKTVPERNLENIEPIRPKAERKLPVVLSRNEIQKLIRGIRNIKHQTIIILIYGTGIRLGETVNIRVDDLDFDRKLAYIKTGKGKKDRIVPLAKLVISKLKNYLNYYVPREFLFEGRDKGKYSPRSIQSILKTALKKAKIEKNASVHSLRHTFATHALEEGTDIRLIQEILGHSNLKTTEIYVHVSKTSILNVQSPIDKLDL